MDALGHTSPQKKLVMWYKVKELKSNGLNYVQIAHELNLHRQTAMKYDKMTLRGVPERAGPHRRSCDRYSHHTGRAEEQRLATGDYRDG